METKPIDVYSEESNFSIVRMPGRNFPGCVIQGDSLHILWKLASVIAEGARHGSAPEEDFLGAVEDLHNSLLTRLLHYQEVIQNEGMNVPYGQPVEAKPVSLLPESQNQA